MVVYAMKNAAAPAISTSTVAMPVHFRNRRKRERFFGAGFAPVVAGTEVTQTVCQP